MLACGICLVDIPNTAPDVVARLEECRHADVEQRWVCVGNAPVDESLRSVTRRILTERKPKYEILNDLLGGDVLRDVDYLVLVDDDILLPVEFLDSFLALQQELGFAIAQPARTPNSWIDLPIVEQHPGISARRTLFVEQGPVISFHRSTFEFVLPFDLTSPMGWGFENLWSLAVTERNLTMGIIDDVPVDHSMRGPVANYDWSEADEERTRLFHSRGHRPTLECFRVLQTFQLSGGR